MKVGSLLNVRWQCRRGMLELDLLLLPFVDQIYDTLAEEQKHQFIELLQYPDQDLFEWFIGKREPHTNELQLLVKKIREQSWKE